jgi:ribosomal protein S18 acetylase RimI-like enzyme
VIERARTSVALRALQRDDREPVHEILVRTGHFTAVEMSTAMELIDDWLTTGEPSGYLCFVATEPATDAVLGYVCVGPAPLTEGTYDLYWIAVDPQAQSRGVGRALLDWAEAEVARRRGRLVLIETSSQEVYRSTVRFYERCGYTLVARIGDYYRPGDDKLVFGKYLAGGRRSAAAGTTR